MKPNKLPPLEHPNAHLQSLAQPSYIDLNRGILKHPMLRRWHVCVPMQARCIGHVCEPLTPLEPRLK